MSQAGAALQPPTTSSIYLASHRYILLQHLTQTNTYLHSKWMQIFNANKWHSVINYQFPPLKYCQKRVNWPATKITAQKYHLTITDYSSLPCTNVGMSAEGETHFPCDLNKHFHLGGRGINYLILLVANLNPLCSQKDFTDNWQYLAPGAWRPRRVSKELEQGRKGLSQWKRVTGDMVCSMLCCSL